MTIPVPRRRGVTRSALAAVLSVTSLAAGCGDSRRVDDRPRPNLALGRAVTLQGGEGDPRVVTDGTILPEATPREAAGAVALAGVRSAVIVDLGAEQPVGALLLQADAADVYFVELSADGNAWYVAWRAEPVAGAAGLRTRRYAMARPLGVRFLRARPTTARSPAIAEVQAYDAEPAAWAALDARGGDVYHPLWPALTRDRLAVAFGALASLFLAVTAWNLAAARAGAGRNALAAVAAAAVLAWPNFMNFHYSGFVHTWESFHYYMGAKYLPELGYTCLYAAAAAADAEAGIDLGGRTMRDLRDNRLVPAPSVMPHAGECRARFSGPRWASFQADAAFFREAMGPEAWLGVRSDHGFNGTPAWAVGGRLLSALGPASGRLLTLVAILDVVLVLAVFAILGRAFGLEAACIAAAFWGVNTFAPFGWTGGGFLRFDWIVLLAGGVAALRGGRPALAGFALGYSALLRVVPGGALAGLAVKAAVEAVEARSFRPLRRHLPLAAGVAAALVVIGAASVLAGGRPGIWSEFAANSRKHLATPSYNLVGVETIVSYESGGAVALMTDPLLLDRHGPWRERVAAARAAAAPARWIASLLFALLLAAAVRRIPDWGAAVLGLGLAPMLFALSSYYYCLLVLFAALATLRPEVGLALAALAWGSTVVSGFWPAVDAQYAVLSLALVAFAVGVAGLFARNGAETAPRNDPP